jgi:membrane-bound lytic murein transglycosylase F
MGVRGMMMLTQQTAKSLGITNRIDPRNSIMGGSRHLADITASINYGLTESDKINFTLATYNLGATNINNTIATIEVAPESLTWNDLKTALMVLDGDEVYFEPQNGYSRGQQTIDFVERTREYALLMKVNSCQDSINQLTAASGT